MGLRVVERIPALPWEPGYFRPGAVHVGLEAGLLPEPGPLEFLQLLWPERYVVWNASRQLWEIRQHNPVTLADERVELLYRTVEAPDGYAVPAYRPFGYEVLEERARQRALFRALGPARYDDAVQEKNRAVSRRLIKDTAREMAAGLTELERYPGPGKWAPVLVDIRKG